MFYRSSLPSDWIVINVLVGQLAIIWIWKIWITTNTKDISSSTMPQKRMRTTNKYRINSSNNYWVWSIEQQRRFSFFFFSPSCKRSYRAIHQCPMKIPPPLKTPTPYGGRLTWVLPGGNFLIAHIKDKTKIRHKKRWSQVRDLTTDERGWTPALGYVHVLSAWLSGLRRSEYHREALQTQTKEELVEK